MCGIAGYVGKSGENAVNVLIDSLTRLEYRGYDSAGIAVCEKICDDTSGTFTDTGEKSLINIVKSKGKLDNLRAKLELNAPSGCVGIGHTRWATHGEPSEANSHPHASPDGRIALVHNGIIENYEKLRDKLTSQGYIFKSQTDTETAVYLIHSYYNGNPLEAIKKAADEIEGSYAFAILFADYPDRIYASRRESPLAVYSCDGRGYIASDAPAIVAYTKDVIYLSNGGIACVTNDATEIYTPDLKPVVKEVTHINWDIVDAEKNGYPHFMLKEIYEQPDALKCAIKHFSHDTRLYGTKRVFLTACGSAYHVCCVAKSVLETLTGICAETDVASEFRYRKPRLSSDDLFIAVSQSGETADTLAALRYANACGANTVAIVNVIGSSIAREAKSVIYTYAGPEIAVATTKAYSAQLVCAYLLILELAHECGYIDASEYERYKNEISEIPAKVSEALLLADSIKSLASDYSSVDDVYFIGRGNDYAAALEASLKLKEISYIHSEAYAAGELKHGTISLIENHTPVFVLATQPHLYDKTASNAVECASRGADIIALVSPDCKSLDKTAKHIIRLPALSGIFTASTAVIPMQLLAYYVSTARGIDPDKPRNLAKSVTVE